MSVALLGLASQKTTHTTKGKMKRKKKEVRFDTRVVLGALILFVISILVTGCGTTGGGGGPATSRLDAKGPIVTLTRTVKITTDAKGITTTNLVEDYSNMSPAAGELALKKAEFKSRKNQGNQGNQPVKKGWFGSILGPNPVSVFGSGVSPGFIPIHGNGSYWGGR
ncbi:hypothetical protein A2917_01880 [Candidatus Nomurabacteria bacterium RIFCSPLOWO2_01_FULL_42_17]|uniref:Uncharacterized protein n=1 Tax=Candidatus Nomurabacteria bacterium RIFCSPLOWO2_01_FULL_42_17 TaxID=1801780 RepID=A0A1F6XLH3_9BACT|nr:MAG: hypothetical protein A2917_01880 [Candidatus Nomurabacteria bacterium RIFCSPLOWO2_01_FULL_42_17]